MTLAADIITDLDVFLNSDEHAVAAVYTPASAEAVSLTVLFNKEYSAIMGMEGHRYWMELKTTDAEDMAPGETVVINSVTYKIKSPPHHTGNGMSEVELTID